MARFALVIGTMRISGVRMKKREGQNCPPL